MIKHFSLWHITWQSLDENGSPKRNSTYIVAQNIAQIAAPFANSEDYELIKVDGIQLGIKVHASVEDLKRTLDAAFEARPDRTDIRL
jgi:hypothetical protein